MRTRCSRLIVAVALLNAGSLVMVSAQTKFGVTVQTSSPDKLAKVATYQWTGGSLSRQVDGLITAAVERELAARGISKVTSGRSDVLVSYSALGRTEVDVKATDKKDGTGREQSIGTLTVDLREAVSRELLFRARFDTPIERDPVTIQTAIDAAVAAIFEKYPGPAKR